MQRIRCVAICVTFAAVACTTTVHDPDDDAAAAALAKRAADYCEATNPDGPQPTKAFVTDQCSLFIDADWDVECCIEHDIRYWCGGTPEQRKAADATFGDCVAENSSKPVGEGMELGVRVGGHPVWPTAHRWGYGHDYQAGYPDEP